MPSGAYLHLDDGIEERFQCAPGPGGWRYTSRRDDGVRLDLVVDARWRQIRVEVVTPGWWLRGGLTGSELAWVRAAGEDRTEHGDRASGFVSGSPGFLVAVARSLELDEGAEADVRLVRLSGTSLSALSVSWRWRRCGTTPYETETEPLPVSEYQITDLSTGEVESLYLAGDIAVAAPGVELTDLDSPPNLRA
ncbi:hypothetical protein F8568_035255 [Actinomadura sp. LD22]|uniref:Glycolipid-binding domain-containing protein n=1 Tax=Actinomadura physcomitrii TaxID=2650748 RepID=A0A6I4M8C7_9ACTN|nr:hypothetical protein [Actinomadura physcomitrii]MVZ98958.1 hypothetical protein [Actinomadura physcomitrii]MWA05532.1 hypothetical protein [Actinomadura physcomitrii]